MQCALPTLPRQGGREPRKLRRNDVLGWLMLRVGQVDDGVMAFGHGRPVAA